MDRPEGRVAVVTGAASGIGLGKARAFASLDAGRMVAAAVKAEQFWVFPNAVPHLAPYRKDLDELFG